MTFRTLDDADLKNKRVLCASTSTSRWKTARCTDATRIERAAPTITGNRRQGRQGDPALAHFGRPKGRDPEGVAEAGRGRRCARDAQAAPSPSPTTASATRRRRPSHAMKAGDVLCLENTRFHKGEEKNEPTSSRRWPSSATSGSTTPSPPRTAPHASTEGLGHKLPAYAGRVDAGRTRGTDQGAGKSPPSRSLADCRRRENFNQARSSRTT